MAEFSDTPWSVSQGAIWDANGKLIAQPTSTGIWRRGEQEANVAVMGAAGELYEALEDLLKKLDRNFSRNSDEAVPDSPIGRAHAALRKARSDKEQG